MERRYQRNDWTEEEQHRLSACHVCIVGCGGIGGYAAEFLTRAGVGQLTLIDGDRFDVSNLNRQRFAETGTLGCGKVEVIAQKLDAVNPEVICHPVAAMITEESGAFLLSGCQVVVDGLDNVPDRLLLQRLCKKLSLPLVHGSVSGWQGQVATILPGELGMERIYPGGGYAGSSSGGKSTPFAPALVASLQAAETIQLLLSRQAPLRGRLLTVDLSAQMFHQYQF